MKLILGAVLFAVLRTVIGENMHAHVGLEFPKVVSIKANREIENKNKYSSELDIQVVNKQNHPQSMVHLDVLLHGLQQARRLAELQDMGILTIETEFHQTQSLRLLQDISQNLTCYRSMEDVYATLDRLVQKYPDFVTTVDIGQSWKMTQNNNDGFHIKALVISAPSNAKRRT